MKVKLGWEALKMALRKHEAKKHRIMDMADAHPQLLRQRRSTKTKHADTKIAEVGSEKGGLARWCWVWVEFLCLLFCSGHLEP